MPDLGNKPIKPGDVFDFAYPFVRDTHAEMDSEGVSEVPCWTPGTRQDDVDGRGNTRFWADGIGGQIITVVGVYKPGAFPERVFYIRKWRSPSGKLFGKGNLRIISISSFRNLVRGFRYEFDLSGAKK